MLADDFLPTYDVSDAPASEGGWVLLGERPGEAIALGLGLVDGLLEQARERAEQGVAA